MWTVCPPTGLGFSGPQAGGPCTCPLLGGRRALFSPRSTGRSSLAVRGQASNCALPGDPHSPGSPGLGQREQQGRVLAAPGPPTRCPHQQGQSPPPCSPARVVLYRDGSWSLNSHLCVALRALPAPSDRVLGRQSSRQQQQQLRELVVKLGHPPVQPSQQHHTRQARSNKQRFTGHRTLPPPGCRQQAQVWLRLSWTRVEAAEAGVRPAFPAPNSGSRRQSWKSAAAAGSHGSPPAGLPPRAPAVRPGLWPSAICHIRNENQS